MSTVLDPTEELDDTDNDEDRAHIVKDKDAEAKITEARVFGTTLIALCGTEFVPKRDPEGLKVCKECREIYYQIIRDDIS